MNFEEKVKSMSGRDIILAMVQSLRQPPIVDVDMNTYGAVVTKKYLFGLFKTKKCFGCAATNTICQISGVKFTPQNIEGSSSRAEAVGTDWVFLNSFEEAINALRCGEISGYNRKAQNCGFATLPENDVSYLLPYLSSDYTEEELNDYERFALTLPVTVEASDSNQVANTLVAG